MFIFHIILYMYMFISHVLPLHMDLYAVNMTLGASVLIHISLLDASMVAYM